MATPKIAPKRSDDTYWRSFESNIIKKGFICENGWYGLHTHTLCDA